MITYAILLLICLALLVFLSQAGGKQYTPDPQGLDLPPELEFQEKVEKEEYGRIFATLVFAIFLIFIFLWVAYGG